MRILVVGGAGYVGSHAVKLLLAKGHDVTVYDNLTRGHRSAVPAGILVEGDLGERAKVLATLKERSIEAVMHFAAFAYVDESVYNPAKYYQNNFVATFELLEAMRAAEVNRFIFSSTTATYGVPDKLPITEDSPQRPINPYGFTKLAVERMLDDYAKAYGLGFAALRYFNAAGASPDGDIGEDHDPETRLIPVALQVALGQREYIHIFGDDYPTPDGTCIRDYVHVDDLASAHLAALDHVEPGKGLKLNLGSENGFSVKEVLDACRRHSGHALPAKISPRRVGDPPALVADATKAKQILGWKPRYIQIDDIVATAWKWHSSHPHGYGDKATPA